ncbi:MAG: hypothetical protein U9R27_05925 [Campylobacterota bacterium]|nr:hypothetical protein [Campylobacterota bacterium]
MKFPSLCELAKTDVVYIDVCATIKEAIDLMLHNEHRNVIIQDEDSYRIFMISKVVYIKKKGIDQNLTIPLDTIKMIESLLLLLKCF